MRVSKSDPSYESRAAALRIRHIDALAITGLLIAATLATWMAHLSNRLPFEDAAMLLRYAENVANGHGIVWNIGEPPVDGATDFLYMLLVAAVTRCGVQVEVAGQVISAVAHVALVVFVYTAIRAIHGSSPVLALIPAIFLALGPGLVYVGAYFGTPLFALAVAVGWFFGLKIILNQHSRAVTSALGFSISMLAAALIRPEGCLLAAAILAVLVFSSHRDFAKRLLICFALAFVVPGASYLAWRWHYFGHPLPNPFYKKGGGVLHPGSLFHSVASVFKMGLFVWPLYLAALWSNVRVRYIALTMIPVTAFTGMWVLISDEMNMAGRFQYAILPVLMMSWPPVAEQLARSWKLPHVGSLPPVRRAVSLGGLALFAILCIITLRSTYPLEVVNYTALAELGKTLRPFQDKHYRLATTEAGLLPLYSGWDTTDVWGLNDAWIARNGVVSSDYLERHRPDVIMFHAYSSPLRPEEDTSANSLPRWSEMLSVLKEYAAKNDYILAAVYGHSPKEAHWYYVRRGLPDAAAIVTVLATMEYDWYGRCIDLAKGARPLIGHP